MQFYLSNLDKKSIILRIDKGEEVISTIEKVSNELQIDSGFFWAIGAIDYALISFYDYNSKSYIDKEINEHMEVISLIGNISYKYGEDQRFIHTHLCASGKDFGTVAGHLKKAIVSVTLEVLIITISDKLERIYNKDFNLFLWKP